ncbi:MAG: mismatch-specific DNA-glycosylase [Bacillota bacterium]
MKMEHNEGRNDEELLAPVPDILADDLCILFVGFNPGLRSSLIGHHYAGYSNRFWRLLAESGLTPRRLSPEEDVLMPEFGFGLTNIVASPSRLASEITSREYAEGRERLAGLIERLRPRIVCYTGIGVYEQFSGKRRVMCGRQEQAVIEGVIDFVVPSPSGLNRISFEKQLDYYRELVSLAKEVCAPRGYLRGLEMTIR